MPTTNQLLKSCRKSKIHRRKSPDLRGCPQKRGVCVRFFIRSPKKPNSAKRKVARVKLSTNKLVMAYMPGERAKLLKFANVLVRGGRVKDLPGVKYKLIRGKLDFEPWFAKKTARSKYGVKKVRKK